MCEHGEIGNDDEIFRLIVSPNSLLIKFGNRPALQGALGASLTEEEASVIVGVVRKFIGDPPADDREQKLQYWNDEYGRRLEAIHKRIEKRLCNVKRVVIYSAYKSDEYGLPTDNLDDRAVAGPAHFILKASSHWGKGRNYESSIIEDATWLDVAVCANEAIEKTGDDHHVFLECIEKAGEVVAGSNKGVPIYELGMGS